MLQCSSQVTASFRRACRTWTCLVFFCASLLLSSSSSWERWFSASSIISCLDTLDTTKRGKRGRMRGEGTLRIIQSLTESSTEQRKGLRTTGKERNAKHLVTKDFYVWLPLHLPMKNWFNFHIFKSQTLPSIPSEWCLVWLALALTCCTSSWSIKAWFSCSTKKACCCSWWLQRERGKEGKRERLCLYWVSRAQGWIIWKQQ